MMLQHGAIWWLLMSTGHPGVVNRGGVMIENRTLMETETLAGTVRK